MVIEDYSIGDQELKEMASTLGYEFRTSIGTAGLTTDVEILKRLDEHPTVAVNQAGTVFTCNPLSNSRNIIVEAVRREITKTTDPIVRVAPASVIKKIHTEELYMHTTAMELEKDPEKETEATENLKRIAELAIDRGVSDIHMQLKPEGLVVEFREDGYLREIPELRFDYSTGLSLTNVAFLLARDTIKKPNTKNPMNGSFELTLGEDLYRFRISWNPLSTGGLSKGRNFGESTIRIFDDSEGTAKTMEELNYPPYVIDTLSRVIKYKSGTIMVGGPTGAGKSKLAHAVLSLVPDGKKINAFEDPVEAINPRFRQTDVVTDSEHSNMRSLLKNLLRQDSDNALVGEIRDEQTALIAALVAMNGHNLVATIHVDRVFEIYNYLVSGLKLTPVQVASESFGTVWLCQRLASELCPKCAIPFNEMEEGQLKEQAKQAMKVNNYKTDGVRFRNPEGCDACKDRGLAGVNGRLPVIELIEIDTAARKYIIEGNMTAWANYLKEHKWKSIADHARYLISNGLLDVELATSEVGVLTHEGTEHIVNYEDCFVTANVNSRYSELSERVNL